MKLTKEEELKLVRAEKIVKLENLGIDPFGQKFYTTGSIRDTLDDFGPTPEDLPIAPMIGGRIVAWRNMGKSQFLDLQDATGKIQVYINKKELTPEQKAIFDLLDIGDIIGLQGAAFLTKSGEKSLHLEAHHVFRVLSKAYRPLPDKFHGLQDDEMKVRQRYLDIIANDASRHTFVLRCEIIAQLRSILAIYGFMEVETPIMQPKEGGAVAQPFKTHHNALGMDLYLRIAPELYLKQLLVAGFPKIYELNRSFRNEGISRRHNPEFTMLEAYAAYSDYEQMATFAEHIVKLLCNDCAVRNYILPDGTVVLIDFSGEWKRVKYHDAIEEKIPGWFAKTNQEKKNHLSMYGDIEWEDWELDQVAFEQYVERVTYQPTFFTHLPKALVPLAKTNKEDPNVVDAFELVIGGMEIAPGYTELNDPAEQQKRFTGNADAEFITALEYGMPPAGGIGIGIDRLVMLLAGTSNIKDVILFPLSLPKNPTEAVV